MRSTSIFLIALVVVLSLVACQSNSPDGAPASACADGQDNDADTLADFPADPGCASAADTEETDPAPPPSVCSDGQDNDGDTLIDFPADLGCTSGTDTDETDPVAPAVTRSRYSMNNQCWALRSNGNGNYVARNATGYTANTTLANAEPFFMKPSALGKYLFYNRNRQLMSVGTAPALVHVATASATDKSEWTVVGIGDTTAYPPTPVYNVEPTPAEVATYHGFADPNLKSSAFTIASQTSNTRLSAEASTGNLVAIAPDATVDSESFSFEPLTADKCLSFPEAQSNFSGTPFKGTQPNGTVLGHTDAHVHVGATTFLGGGHWGSPYHKFGVEHALGDCDAEHGSDGRGDELDGVYNENPNGHATDGWPTFSEWPARANLTHEAIYWKWLERSWAAGLRVLVNDLVDNETLCELQRNASESSPERDCNEMNNAGQQAGTMYGMQDYIDAQYGGRGAGFFQIVHDAAAARDVIEDGKMAVVLGIEISNLFNCKVTYNPLRQDTPETEDGTGPTENTYACTTDETQPNSIKKQMERIYAWGVRQVISIHEFDNAFGGYGIQDGRFLNLGNRENSGGNPTPGFPPGDDPFAFNPPNETPTGEFATTYDCPVEGETPGFTGYLWDDAGGYVQEFLSPPMCTYTGQGDRHGGTTPCYPAGVPQCNARWMTLAGEYTYGKMMEMGFLFDWDHMEMGMKTQALELAEAQNPVYPFVSTHGTYSGTTINQATRLLRNGGFLYPANSSSRGFRGEMDETRTVHAAAMAAAPAKNFLFAFGYGTDTNGLSKQSATRGGNGIDGQSFKSIVYPFTLFDGDVFDSLPGFTGLNGVEFAQPRRGDAADCSDMSKCWHEDIDGNAHHGMISDFIQEIRLEGTPEQMMDLFNSAEAYLQTWQRTEAAQAAIEANGLKTPASPIRRPAPPEGAIAP